MYINLFTDPAHIVGDISSEVSSPTMEMPSSASALLAQGAGKIDFFLLFLFVLL